MLFRFNRLAKLSKKKGVLSSKDKLAIEAAGILCVTFLLPYFDGRKYVTMFVTVAEASVAQAARERVEEVALKFINLLPEFVMYSFSIIFFNKII